MKGQLSCTVLRGLRGSNAPPATRLHGGMAAIPLNQHAHPVFVRDADGVPRCPKGLRMVPTSAFAHTNGYRAQRYRCPLLFPSPTGHTCDHKQFKEGKGCVKDINVELGGLMRVTLDRSAPLYRLLYNQRTSVNVSTVNPRHSALNGPKYVMDARFTRSIP